MPTITDWLMVVITAVYVVATIFICCANINSAKATREQVAESKKQYEDAKRPHISYQLIFERRAFYGMRFTNQGGSVANHVKILLDREFVESIIQFKPGSALKDLHEKEFSLGIGQSYDIFFGSSEFRNNPAKKPIRGSVIYQDAESTYHEEFEIDFEKYATIFSVNTPTEDLQDEIKKQTIELARIAKELQSLSSQYESNSSPSKAEDTDQEEVNT